MPDANGQLFFEDFISELQARGFDGFSVADLGTFVNRAYFAVARKAKWEWEETTDTFTIAPGASSVNLWPTVGGELPNFRSLDRLYSTTAGHEKKMVILKRDRFFTDWLSLDLTAVARRAEPTNYYVYERKLYVIPPPASSRDFIAHYHQRVSILTNGQVPLTPVYLDEAIVDAARVRAHTRSNEPAFAKLAREDLEEQFDDMRDDEEQRLAEEPTRTTPDTSWL